MIAHSKPATRHCRAIAAAADGDARRALGLLETVADLAVDNRIAEDQIADLAAGTRRRFDKGGDQFYDQISALHKAVRGSDPDASLYWLARMLDGGLRSLLSREAHHAHGGGGHRPSAIRAHCPWRWKPGRPTTASAAPRPIWRWAQCVVFLAVAPKSNAVYTGLWCRARGCREIRLVDVPARFRNAPTRLMRELGHGKGYRYAHDEADAYAAGERYLPDEMPDRRYYFPVQRGFEIRIAEAMQRRQAQDQTTKNNDRKEEK